MDGRRPPSRGRRAEVFSAACREGSLAAAARSLGIEHRDALRAVKELEDDMGEELFLRMRGGVVPTAAGAELYRELSGRPAPGGEERPWDA